MWPLHLLGLLIALALSGTVSAKDGPAPNATTAQPKLQTIFDYKAELGLTDQQIEAEVNNLGVGIAAGRKKITELESKYVALVPEQHDSQDKMRKGTAPK